MALFLEYHGNSPELNVTRLVMAAVLLGILGGLALWAEHAGMQKAPDHLWTAFQTVMGVIVGFLGGEAIGIATPRPQ